MGQKAKIVVLGLVLVAVALSALGVQAGEVAPSWQTRSKAWGTEAISVVRLDRTEGPMAEVVFVNRLSRGVPLEFSFPLAIDGLQVDIAINQGRSAGEDVITVLPPPGYQALPQTLSVPDNTTARIPIVLAAMS